MKGQIPIIDKKGDVVARLSWKGDERKGTGTWWYATKDVEKSIINLIEFNADLKKVGYADMTHDAGTVRGWTGFAGNYQALCSSLPSIGLDVDDENITWPM